MYSAYKLNKQGDNTALTYSLSYLEPVCCSMSSSNCCFLTCIQVSQEAGQVVWCSHLCLACGCAKAMLFLISGHHAAAPALPTCTCGLEFGVGFPARVLCHLPGKRWGESRNEQGALAGKTLFPVWASTPRSTLWPANLTLSICLLSSLFPAARHWGFSGVESLCVLGASKLHKPRYLESLPQP